MATRVKLQRLRSKGLTLEQIGEMCNPPISAERVRQILHPKPLLRCETHQVNYEKHCSRCYIEAKYPSILQELKVDTPLLQAEIERLSKQDRTLEVVIQRSMLIKLLHDKFEYSFSHIARLLKRDHTAIMNLYYKQL